MKMTVTQQIAILRKVAKLDKSRANVSISRYGFSGRLEVDIHSYVDGTRVRVNYGNGMTDGCKEINGYDEIIRMLDKMIQQYKEQSK